MWVIVTCHWCKQWGAIDEERAARRMLLMHQREHVARGTLDRWEEESHG